MRVGLLLKSPLIVFYFRSVSRPSPNYWRSATEIQNGTQGLFGNPKQDVAGSLTQASFAWAGLGTGARRSRPSVPIFSPISVQWIP